MKSICCVCFHVCISLHRGKAAILVVRNSLSLPKVRATQNRMWEVRSSTHLCRPAARRPRTAERENVYSSLSQSETLEGNVILSQQSELSYNAAFLMKQIHSFSCHMGLEFFKTDFNISLYKYSFSRWILHKKKTWKYFSFFPS